MSPMHRLRRSLLFVPANEARKVERALDSGADTVLLDLEDAVPPDQKGEARAAVADLLRRGGSARPELAARINPPGTPWFEDDLSALARAGVHALVLPKCDGPESVSRAAALLDARGTECGRPAGDGVRLLGLVESALGVTRAAGMGDVSPRLEALCLGHADFSLDMGISEPDSAAGVVLHARCQVAIGARASRLTPIDTVCFATRDETAFRTDAELGRRLGFEGKLCIHPAQVAIANEVHTPSAEQIEAAQRVVAAWRDARAEGRAVFALDGKMVDGPVVAMHERVLERARRAGVLRGPG